MQVPVIFLGSDASLSERLSDCYAAIAWDPAYLVVPAFAAGSRERWRELLPARGRGLVYLEMSADSAGADAPLIGAVREYNPGLQLVLLAEDAVDYFRVAQDFRIGNVLKKGRFDPSIVRALSVRLLTGNIFGFDPYFPDGFTQGPLYRHYSGKVLIEEVIRESMDLCRPYVPAGEVSSFQVFLHELLTNTFAYAIEGISPEERDAKLLRPPPEVFIPERKAIKVTLAADREKIGFSVQDSSGNLSMLRVLQKLRRQSKIGGEKMPPGIWDESGRGMSLVYRFSRFIVNILQGVRTETIFLHYRQPELNRFESIIITEVTPLF